MRPELAVTLSVAALTALGLNLVPVGTHGTNDQTSVGLEQSLAAARAALAAQPSAASDTSPQAEDRDTTRALFPAASISVSPPSAPEAPAAPAPRLLLRGIVSVNSAPRAIFGVEDQSVPYRTVGTGDTIDAYTVDAIGEDSVTLRTVDGQIEIFQLRGTGELPRY
jgi:hypothetical protein